ncbi:spore coat protein [Halalkalibacter urbisdiaboli]|uniref:spore coat protein n=1 Tax=Halalkalibacter urbisdiaboli TaxID=1960589 RepID=UPI000B449F5A|nr:spore coat protein [Halalkalibacter urbisdiaboli]
MPNNIEGRGLTDREMLQLCLELEKGRCRSISQTMLETSHQELRKIYQQWLDNANDNQIQLYEVMSQKGWYKTAPASVEQINQTQKLMQNNLHPDNQF